MPRYFRSTLIIAAASILFIVHSSIASVGLLFTNGTSSYNSANVSPGASFGFSVKVTETAASDQISGVDYQIHASTSGVFEFLSRNSQVSGSSFTYSNGSSDSALTAVVLNPNNGTDLGTSTSTGAAIAGPGTYEISDFSFEVLPSAPKGIYTLSFASTDTAGAPPSYPVGNFSTLGTYTVFVPGPVLLGDANYDGKIDGSDYSLIDNGYAQHLSGWTNGDFNLDGKIDGSDYTLIDNAFNTQTPSPSALVTAEISSTSVPEPSILLLSVSTLLLRRKRARFTTKTQKPYFPCAFIKYGLYRT